MKRRRPLPALVRVTAAGSGELVCARCEVADTVLRRTWGLLGRRGLEPDGGMLITRTGSVMTFFMRFPIDVVFLDRDERVVGIAHDLRPWRIAAARRAKSSLELPAGTAAGRGLRVGDVLVFEAAGAEV